MVCLVFRRAAASRFLSIATFSSGILRCAWCFAELPWTYFLDRPYYLSECQAARHSVDIIVTVAICACHLSETQTLLEARLGKLHIKGIVVSLLFPQPTPLTP